MADGAVRKFGVGITYRGRIAPTPSGLLHLGHYSTFRTAQSRAQQQCGKLILRIEDIDRTRCRAEFNVAIMEDLHWAELQWHEGPDCGGKYAPYVQSERLEYYRQAFMSLKKAGWVYPCKCSRRDVARSAAAPHDNTEPLYPGTCRELLLDSTDETMVSWRFRVPAKEMIRFNDARLGPQAFQAEVDFGDFIVWRRDGWPAYELAVVVDDAAMGITEVVRGEDLLLSTARQLLLYRALALAPPDFYHCALITDNQGQRLAKSSAATSLRALRQRGVTPQNLASLVHPAS
jgi:glutamyl/glutaminyl-tRNA synthetase